jgi:hypothetical protein
MRVTRESLALVVISALGALVHVSGSPSILNSERLGRNSATTKPSTLSSMEGHHAWRRDAHELKNSPALNKLLAVNGEECGLENEQDADDESILHGHGRLGSPLLSRGGALPRNKKVSISVANETPTTIELLMQRFKIGFYFALWYVLNVMYNSKCNKKLTECVWVRQYVLTG